MVTLQQHLSHRKPIRLPKFHKVRTKALKGNPQKRGIVSRLSTEHPKKPNSAKRKVARIRIRGRKNMVRVKVPGEGHGTLQKFSAVLIRGHRARDLPGIRHAIIRGKLGSNPVLSKRKGRSKVGVKKGYVDQLKARNEA